MKRIQKFSVLLIALYGVVACSENEDVSTPEINKEEVSLLEVSSIVKNKVESKIATAYEFKFGEPSEIGVVMYENSYDTNGNLLDSTLYKGGAISFIEKYSYNDNNDLIERAVFDSSGNKLQLSKRTFNKNGNEAEFLLYNGDSLYYKQYKEYDDQNKLIKLVEYNQDGKTQIISLFEYNDLGEVITETQTNGAGNILSKIVYSFDENGNKTSITSYNTYGNTEGKTVLSDYENGSAKIIEKYDSNDSLYASYQYDYNEKGNETKSIIYNGVGQIIRQSNTSYDGSGNKVQFEIFEGEVGFLGKDVISYNKNNQEIELIVFDGKDKQVKRKETKYNDKQLIWKEVTYNKVDEPVYQFVYNYTHFK